MVRQFLAFLVVLIGATSLRAVATSPTASREAVSSALPWCISATDPQAQRLVLRLQDLVSSTDSVTAALRDSLASLPALPAAQVSAVGDEMLCQRASQALDSLFFTAPRAEPLYLIKVGPRYVAHPTSVQMGEFGYLVHLNSEFTQMLAISTW